jgi:hypothetical protein
MTDCAIESLLQPARVTSLFCKQYVLYLPNTETIAHKVCYRTMFERKPKLRPLRPVGKVLLFE